MEHIKNGVEFSDMDIETKDKVIKELCSRLYVDPSGNDFIEIEFECDNCTHSWKESFYDMIDEYLNPSERKKVYEYLKKEYEK